jgi:hypothetical protein
MLDFNDPRQKTDTCFKLECGHAYHTACIIRYLSNSNHSCLHCNEIKTPAEELTIAGLARKLSGALSRHPEVRYLKAEVNEATNEYKNAIKELKTEINQYIKRRIAETNLREKRAYMKSAENAVKAKQREIAKEMGREYVGAIEQLSNRRFRSRWKFWSLLHPRFGMRL